MKISHGLVSILSLANFVWSKSSHYWDNNSSTFQSDGISPVASTKNGTVIGTYNANYDQDMFLGIPYATPPVGNMRYRQPQPVNETWDERPATAFGDWCIQAPLDLVGFSRPGYTQPESEDCLTINIVRPAGVDRYSRLPVLVWFYGGGLQEGGSADQRYNSSFIVEESVNIGTPIVHVTLNYRVSGFGFLPGSAILDAGAANLGFYDQRLALRWIQENIAAFGGDPSHVTISGESAGAQSVGIHYLAYSGRDDGLFHAGICESSGPLASSVSVALERQNQVYNRVLNLSGCVGANDTLECLRTVPAATLREIFQKQSYTPIIDGGIISDHAYNNLQAGNFIKRPLLIGSNLNEGTSFTLQGQTGVDTSDEFAEVVSSMDTAQVLTNSTRDLIVRAYMDDLSDTEVEQGLGTVKPSPSPTLGSLFGRVSLFMGDFSFLASQRFVSQLWAEAGVPAFGYRFDVTPNGFDPSVNGASHFAEIGFVFKNDGLGWPVNPLMSEDMTTRQGQLKLAETMSRMWISFANTYNPNPSHGKFAFDLLDLDCLIVRRRYLTESCLAGLQKRQSKYYRLHTERHVCGLRQSKNKCHAKDNRLR